MFDGPGQAQKGQEASIVDETPQQGDRASPYAIANLGEHTTLRSTSGMPMGLPAPGEAGNLTAMLKDMPLEDAAPSEDRPIKGHSAEARAYHCRYEELSEMHDKGEYDTCKEGCLDLLTEARIPRYTRIQTLQMVSTLFKPALAEDCLHRAAKVLESMDASTFQVVVLKEDNEKMLADLMVWRGKRGSIGESIEDQDDEDDEPTEAWFKMDRDLEEKLENEVQEELEPFVQLMPTSQEKEKGEEASAGPAPAGGLPSPQES